MMFEMLEPRQVLSSIPWQASLPATNEVALSNETSAPRPIAGDANHDLRFDQQDLVQVLQAGKYMTGEAASWAEGDWDGARGADYGYWSEGDGRFNQFDIVVALQTGAYGSAHYSALAPNNGFRGDEQTSIIYNPETGELMVDAPQSRELTSINIDSASGILGGGNNLFRASFGSSFGSFSWGTVASRWLSEDFVRNDLTVIGSLAGGGDLGPVDLATWSCVPSGGSVSAPEIARFGSAEELEQYLQSRPERPSPFEPPLEVFQGSGSFDGGFGGSFDNNSGAGGGPPTHSDTNTQVVGVDEADLVETDGDYLYVVSDNTLVIADAWPLDDIRVLSRWRVNGDVVGQYLVGDRLAIVSQTDRVHVSVLDISDRAAPALVQWTEFEGTYVESRAIGDFVYVVSRDDFRAKLEETRGETADRNIVELALPHFYSFDAKGTIASGYLSEPTDIYKPVLPGDSELLSVTVFDVTSDQTGPEASVAVPSTPSSQVYASVDSIYLVNPNCSVGSEGQASSILKLDVVDRGRRVELTAFGDVPGRPLETFSIDEYRDNLRIATFEGAAAEMENRVYVLRQFGGELRTVGRTESMATGERIRSVRFLQDTGYVVTFPDVSPTRFVDPLFTVDLSDPTDPKVIGELEIPGFSNYLHPVGDDYLIGLGRDADQRTGRPEQLQLSLFRVSDLTNPFQADRYQFDLPAWADSEALEDHHAIAYYPESQILSLPVTNPASTVTIDQNGDGIVDITENRPRTDLWVFYVDLPGEGDPGAGIEFLGRVEQNSETRRSVRIGDYLYAISNHSVDVYPMIDPSHHAAALYFGQEDVGVPVFRADSTDPAVGHAIDVPDRAAPQVLDVRVRSSRWTSDFVDYLDYSTGDATRDVLPYEHIDQIQMTFNEDVFGAPILRPRGVAVSQYTIDRYAYDPESRTGTWTLREPIGTDTVSLRLYGVVDEDGNRLDGDADGRAGGWFRHKFSVLPGDLNADGYVDRADVLLTGEDHVIGFQDSNYVVTADVNGTGAIDASDRAAVRDGLGGLLPRLQPRLSPGDTDGDGIFGQLDLVRVLQSAKYMNGVPASWGDGDWNRDGFFDQLDFVLALEHGFTPGRPVQNVEVDRA